MCKTFKWMLIFISINLLKISLVQKQKTGIWNQLHYDKKASIAIYSFAF